MSRTWKWILGILGVLVVVGLIAGAVFMWRTNGFRMMTRVDAPGSFERPAPPSQPGAPQTYREFRRYHMEQWGGGMPMMGDGYNYPHRAFGPFGTGLMLVGGLFHLLVPLGVLALVAYVFYQMGKRAGSRGTPRLHAGCGIAAAPQGGPQLTGVHRSIRISRAGGLSTAGASLLPRQAPGSTALFIPPNCAPQLGQICYNFAPSPGRQ